MNTRIQHLLAQAGIVQPERFDSIDGNNQLEKLVSLVVTECACLIQQQVSLKYKDGWEKDGLTDDWVHGHYAASTLSRTVIKQHFGVK